MPDWLYFILAAIALFGATLMTRGSFFFLSADHKLPAAVERALRYAPACALSAIIAPSVLTDKSGHLIADPANPRMWGLIAASVVFVYRRSMLLMMCVGMAVFTAIRLVTQ